MASKQLMRWELITALAARCKEARYLEIGVQSGRTGAQVKATRKWGVDPKPYRRAGSHYHRLDRTTSDKFFKTLSPDERFDVVFIDGLHHGEQVYRDTLNALEHLAPGGTIVLHDCNPQKEIEQRIPHTTQRRWNGDCWKALVGLRSERDDLQAYVLNADEGLGVVRRGPSVPIKLSKPWQKLEWNDLVEDRVRLLGLVPPVYHTTPVFLNNFNCLEWLKAMVSWLLAHGHSNIHVVDNDSGWKPLVEWYDGAARELPIYVHRLDRNVGKYAPWHTGLVKKYAERGGYYLVSDPDLDLSGVPGDALSHLREILDAHPESTKVGLGLRVNDIPADAMIGTEAIVWERRMWKKEVAPGIYRAPVDTTFALYRTEWPNPMAATWSDLRCDHPYVARHMPWYLTPATMTDEDRFRYDQTRYGKAVHRSGYWGRAVANVADGKNWNAPSDARFNRWASTIKAPRQCEREWRVVIPSNSALRLRKSVNAILMAHPDVCPSRIVVVDDGAKVEWSADDPAVTWVRGITPFVYARNLNVGLRASAPFDVVVMGDDCLPQTPDSFHRLFSESSIVSAGIQGIVGNEMQRWQPNQTGRVTSGQRICFVCVYIARSVIEKVGFLDEAFVGYGGEDTDYCWRAQQNGFALEIERGVHVKHNHGRGMNSGWRSKPDVRRHFLENRRRLLEKWPGRTWSDEHQVEESRA